MGLHDLNVYIMMTMSTHYDWLQYIFHGWIASRRTKSHVWIRSTYWGQVTYICVSKFFIIDSNIVWTSAEILLIGPLGTNFSEILIEIHILLFKKMHLRVSSAKYCTLCLGHNMLLDSAVYKKTPQIAANNHNYLFIRQSFCAHCDAIKTVVLQMTFETCCRNGNYYIFHSNAH